MKQPRSVLVLGLSVVILLISFFLYEQRKPDCVEAQTCVTVFSGIQAQSAACGCNAVGCSTSCGVAGRPNQACFLSEVRVGDMGGGGDQAGCSVAGTTVTASASSDGRPIRCAITCINFI